MEMKQNLKSMGLFEKLRVHIARVKAEKQLKELDDRLLADIGLSRADIGRRLVTTQGV
jgi:uncharacterized protein YjiS (DUF1127 family)